MLYQETQQIGLLQKLDFNARKDSWWRKGKRRENGTKPQTAGNKQTIEKMREVVIGVSYWAHPDASSASVFS